MVLSQLDRPCYDDSYRGPAHFNGGGIDGGWSESECRKWEDSRDGKLLFVGKIKEKNKKNKKKIKIKFTGKTKQKEKHLLPSFATQFPSFLQLLLTLSVFPALRQSSVSIMIRCINFVSNCFKLVTELISSHIFNYKTPSCKHNLYEYKKGYQDDIITSVNFFTLIKE